jgi:hypothetical protein
MSSTLQAGVHPLFSIDEPLPVAPGESPFHIRGLYYDRLVAYIKKAGKLEGVLDSLDDPRVRAFAEQRFSWTGWFDALPAVPICATFARCINEEFESGLRKHTRRAAVEVIPSAFRFPLLMSGPTALSTAIGHLGATMMDFIELGAEETTSTHSHGWYRGIPRFVAPHTANIVLGFFHALLELRGARTVSARYTDVEKDVGRAGYETVAIRYEFDWE